MAKKKTNIDNLENVVVNQEEVSKEVESSKGSSTPGKKANSDYIRLDLKPFGYDLKDYADKKAAALSIERGRKVSTTAFIQELIIADMESEKEKGKPTKHDKIVSALSNLDDKKLSAIATLLDIQL